MQSWKCGLWTRQNVFKLFTCIFQGEIYYYYFIFLVSALLQNCFLCWDRWNVTWCLQLTQPCYVALGRVLILVVSQIGWGAISQSNSIYSRLSRCFTARVVTSRDPPKGIRDSVYIHIAGPLWYHIKHASSGIWSTKSRKWQMCLNIVVALPLKPPWLDKLSFNTNHI